LKSISEKPASLLPSSEGTSSGESESEECVDEEFCFFPDFHEPLPVNEFTELIRNDLKPRGYPMATRLEGGMHLVNTFEEEFVEDTWCKLSKKVASDTSRSVVSLASFKGDHYILFPYICLFSVSSLTIIAIKYLYKIKGSLFARAYL